MNKEIRSIRIRGKAVTVVLTPGDMDQICSIKEQADMLGDADFKAERGHNNLLTRVTVDFNETSNAKELFDLILGTPSKNRLD